MIRVKRKVNKKIIVSLLLLAAFAVLLTASILLNVLTGGESGTKPSAKPPLEVLEGESTHGGFNVAYPFVNDGALQYISVSDKANSFKLIRPDEKGDMVLYYTDSRGATEVYYPSILGTDENISYSSLYAIDQSDGLGMGPLVSYLCSAVGFTAFQERIALSEDESTRSSQLTSFGFTANEYVTVSVAYSVETEEGEEPELERHTIKIGRKSISGSGRYFMVDDREYIYCAATDYFEYALQGYMAFIKPYLVTEGMRGDDSVLAAYLTQDFREWKNTVHSDEGSTVAPGAQVIVNAQTVIPSDPYGSYSPAAGDDIDGYRYGQFEKTAFFLDKLEDSPSASRIIKALTGKAVGVYYDYMDPFAKADDAIIFTLTSQSKAIDFGEKKSVKYEYTVYSVESFIDGDEEIISAGTPVGDAKLLKISYSLKVDGKAIGKYRQHAIVDLDDTGIPAEVRTALSSAVIGELAAPVSFSIDYTTDNAVRYDVEYVICDILEIYDKDGKAITEITADSSVVYRYYLVVDGERNDDIHVGSISLSATEDESEDDKKIREALVGKGLVSDASISVMTYTEYSELFYDFITYRVAEIEYYITSELVTAFGFVNASDRDPFYGESFYTNKLEDKNSLYGINADSCINIVKYFMGIANESSSTTSAEGLTGIKTVAIGLTPEVMEKYGLYAYTLYIELPRGIYPRNDENFDDENALDNYDWRDTLSFYLYISEEQFDGTRYIASDLYDLVATIDGEIFSFLEYDFADFWARRNLLLTDFKNVDNMKLEFGMDDLYGKYNFDIIHEILFVDENGNSYVKPPEDIYTDVYNISHINVTQSGNCTETAFSKFLADKGLDSTSLTVLYNNLRGDGSMIMGNRDTFGSSQFKNLMHLVYGVYYTDTLDDLTAEEKAEINSGKPMMRLDVSLDSKGHYYTFEFHKVDDWRIMVTLYRSDSDGVQVGEGVSDFYISRFAFKKIVRGFVSVLNAEDVDADIGYPKED